MKRIGKNKTNVGILAEDIALKWLISKGFIFVTQNFTSFHGEIDIIMTKDGVTYFIEVKSISISHETPNLIDLRENFSKNKSEKMIRAIEYYLIKNKSVQKFKTVLICVYINKVNKRARIKYIENPIL